MNANRLFLLSLSFVSLACLSLSLTGCVKVNEVSTPQPATSNEASDDDHAHDHKHGPNGFPVVEMNDGTDVEWGFDKSSSTFTVVHPAAEEVEKVVVKTVVDGNQTTYEFASQTSPAGVSWTLESPELGAAMSMGDLVARTLMITMKDGNEQTSPVAPNHGH